MFQFYSSDLNAMPKCLRTDRVANVYNMVSGTSGDMFAYAGRFGSIRPKKSQPPARVITIFLSRDF
jgi:hypothetical protein